jgi:hypothetical protein
MSTVREIILDATRLHGRVVAPATSSDLERLLATLKERKSGTLYLKTARECFFMIGVASRVWQAHLCRGGDDPLWLSDPPRNGRRGATFDCGGTPTKIEARFTCRPPAAILACREFFLAPEAIPPGNWVGEWSGLPIRSSG